MEGYFFGAERLEELLLRTYFPEKADHETKLLLEFLAEYGRTFERIGFSVRVGQGNTPNPDHEPGVQRSTAFSSKRRIDFVGLQGKQATLVEMKTRVGHQVLGQLLSDRQLWIGEFPDAPEPILVAVGRSSTPEELAILSAHGITVLLYAEANAAGNAPRSPVGPGDGAPA